MWYNHMISNVTGLLGTHDVRSLHGGCDVVEGSKWIANNWINAPFEWKEDSWWRWLEFISIFVWNSTPNSTPNEVSLDLDVESIYTFAIKVDILHTSQCCFLVVMSPILSSSKRNSGMWVTDYSGLMDFNIQFGLVNDFIYFLKLCFRINLVLHNLS